jgi:hypothetical protein
MLRALTFNEDTEVGMFAVELLRAMERGEEMREAILRLAAEHASLFEDLDGRLLLRALSLSP